MALIRPVRRSGPTKQKSVLFYAGADCQTAQTGMTSHLRASLIANWNYHRSIKYELYKRMDVLFWFYREEKKMLLKMGLSDIDFKNLFKKDIPGTGTSLLQFLT
jgi:hypothetical protein